MGIDIRNGLQMECIACGLCVDACNHVMDKLDLPHGLIRFDTENNRVARLDARKPDPHIFRLRTLWYVAILTVVGALMVYGLVHRAVLEMNIVHDRNPLFVTLSDGSIRNAYRVAILNKTHQDRVYSLSLEGITPRELRIQAAQDLQADELPVFADSVGHFRVFITADKQEKARRKIVFSVKDTADALEVKTETIFISGVQ
jgi:polyferredoxin